MCIADHKKKEKFFKTKSFNFKLIHDDEGVGDFNQLGREQIVTIL